MTGKHLRIDSVAREYVNSPKKSLNAIISEHRPNNKPASVTGTASRIARNADFWSIVNSIRMEMLEKHKPETYFKVISDRALNSKEDVNKIKASKIMLEFLGFTPPRFTRNESVNITLDSHDLAKLRELLPPTS